MFFSINWPRVSSAKHSITKRVESISILDLSWSSSITTWRRRSRPIPAETKRTIRYKFSIKDPNGTTLKIPTSKLETTTSGKCYYPSHCSKMKIRVKFLRICWSKNNKKNWYQLKIRWYKFTWSASGTSETPLKALFRKVRLRWSWEWIKVLSPKRSQSKKVHVR